jgi:fructose-1,6-bisphosphatase
MGITQRTKDRARQSLKATATATIKGHEVCTETLVELTSLRKSNADLNERNRALHATVKYHEECTRSDRAEIADLHKLGKALERTLANQMIERNKQVKLKERALVQRNSYATILATVVGVGAFVIAVLCGLPV